MSMIASFQSVIKTDYHLPKNGSFIQITEGAQNADNRELLIGGASCFGFSLDQSGSHPWGFIVPNPPAGIVSVCDGIVIASCDGNDYVFIIDLKSKSKSADAKALKQLCSGKYIFEWLFNVMKLHRHVHTTPNVIGVVCKSRGTVAKRGTRKGINVEKKETDQGVVLIVANPGRISVQDLISNV